MSTLPQSDLFVALVIVIATILGTLAACGAVALYDHGLSKGWWRE